MFLFSIKYLYVITELTNLCTELLYLFLFLFDHSSELFSAREPVLLSTLMFFRVSFVDSGRFMEAYCFRGSASIRAIYQLLFSL